MKHSIALISLGLLLGTTACVHRTSAQGGDIASDTDRGFKLTAPILNPSVKQGEVTTVPIAIDREKYFTQDVHVVVKEPEGLDIEPADHTIKGSDVEDLQLVITAANNAALGSHRVIVEATPQTGKQTWVQFDVKVEAP